MQKKKGFTVYREGNVNNRQVEVDHNQIKTLLDNNLNYPKWDIIIHAHTYTYVV